MTTITITIEVGGEQYIHQVEGESWAKDEEGNRYVYDGDDDDPVAEVGPENFVSIMKEPADD